MKVSLNVPDDLLKRVDSFSEANFVSRSLFVTLAMKEYLDNHQLEGAILSLSFSLRKIADSGVVDEDLIQQLEDLKRLINCSF